MCILVRQLRCWLAAAVASLSLALMACDNGASPTPRGPERLVKVAGDMQAGAVGTLLAIPLVVRLVDGDSRPIPNRIVHFEVLSGGGRLAPDSTTTDATGTAQATWTLGLADGKQAVAARADGLAGLSFSADASGVCTGLDVVPRTSFPGIEDGNKGNYDHSLAVGRDGVVLVTNNSIALFHKTGHRIDQQATHAFFGAVRPVGADILTDPYALYDPSTDRFFVAMSDGIFSMTCAPGDCTAVILLAVSKSGTPRSFAASDWHFYKFDRNKNITAAGTTLRNHKGDFDHLGVTNQLLVVGMQMVKFENGIETGAGGKIRVFDKAALIGGAPVTSWLDFPDLPERPIPALGPKVLDRLLLYFREDCSSGSGQPAKLVLGAVAGGPGSPTLTMNEVVGRRLCPATSEPNTAEQPGLALSVNHQNVAPAATDRTMWIARDGRSTSTSDVLGVWWAQIDVGAWPSVSLVADTVIGGDVWKFLPAIGTDNDGNVLLAFAGSNATTNASTYYSSRMAGDPLGSMRAPRMLSAGTAAHIDIVEGRNRFGDYLAVVTDPVDESFWVAGSYAAGGAVSRSTVSNLVACR